MGLDVGGIVNVGEKFIPHQIIKGIKKYDPDTGEPYFRHEKTFEYRKEFDDSVMFSENSQYGEYEIDSFYSNNLTDDDGYEYIIQGCKVCSTDLRNGDHVCVVPFNLLTELISKYQLATGRLPAIYNFLSYS